LFQTLDLNDKHDDNVKILNRNISKTLLVNDRNGGYQLVDAKLVKNSNLEEQFRFYFNITLILKEFKF
jgi:hypothetical protein